MHLSGFYDGDIILVLTDSHKMFEELVCDTRESDQGKKSPGLRHNIPMQSVVNAPKVNEWPELNQALLYAYENKASRQPW